MDHVGVRTWGRPARRWTGLVGAVPLVLAVAACGDDDEESVRSEPTDPMFSRWVMRDPELHGVAIPEGSVVHLCLGSANRTPSGGSGPTSTTSGGP